MERKIPVLCLCSVTRPSVDGREKAPTLASLRESGQLEMVELLFRPEYVAFHELAQAEEPAPRWR